MSPELFTVVLLSALLGGVVIGLPVLVVLGSVSFVGMYLITGQIAIAIKTLSSTAMYAVNEYVFVVIPMFLIMGELISRSGAARDLYFGFSRALGKIPGRLAVATVAGNAVLAAIVGVSIASAAAYTKIAYPVMRASGYDRLAALGCIAGSSSLGMLIPPSILMIVWGILTGQSIGALFIAGIIPGLLLALGFIAYCVISAIRSPEKYTESFRAEDIGKDPTTRFSANVGLFGCVLLIVIVIGGIWTGLITPNEAAALGVLCSVGIALAKKMSLRDIFRATLEASRMSATVMFLMIFAQMYSRVLTLGGVGDVVSDVFLGLAGGSDWVVFLIMGLAWITMGMFIDSISIVLLTIPIFWPVMQALGGDLIAISIAGILLIEAGIISPPFGLAVFTVKLCIDDPDIRTIDIFIAALPFLCILIGLALLIFFIPSLASWLPRVAFM